MDHGKAHASLSPSSAERWIACPASVGLVASLGRTDEPGGSVWADEGTRAHTRAELEARLVFDHITVLDYETAVAAWEARAPEEDDVEEMGKHAQEYAAVLLDVAADLDPSSTQVLLEQRVYPGITGVWGTSDAVLYDETTVAAVDYKYGKGVRVRAEGNPQARLYALGALEAYGDVLGTTERVKIVIHQPRIEGGTTSETMTAADLRAWRDLVARPSAEETQRPDARFGPSEEACRWCPAAGICKARLVHVTRRDFGDPRLLGPDELADAVKRLPEIRDWCNAVDAEGLHQAYSEGTPLPGLKVVMSRGKRGITDDAVAIERLVAAGYDRDKVARPGKETAQTLGTLETVVGKDKLPGVLGDVLQAGQGKPSLVPEDHPGEAISPTTEAQKDFQAE